MSRTRWILFSLFALSPLLLPAKGAPAPATATQVVLINVSGPIGPATSDFVHRSLANARTSNAALMVLRLDTPGGLDTAMRRIIQDILASPVPVATFVAPSGARAASAGAYILIASHIAAMAPGTTTGAATPVRIGGVPDPGDARPLPGFDQDKNAKDKNTKDKNTKDKQGKAPPSRPGMDEKVLQDAIAYIRGLAQMRGRNVAWAERAVREAASLPAEEAVKQNVVDLIATDVADLLKRIDGRKITLDGRELVLKTAGAAIQTIEPDWRARLLAVITDPNIAYILMLLGIYGLFFELWNPGYILPGVIGGICLLLALYAFQVLPINYAGVGLILLGIAFMVAEAFAPSFGALGIGGVIAFVAGSVILMDTDIEGVTVAWPLIVTVSLVSALFFFAVAWFAMQARRRAVVSGAEEMLGAPGEALEDFEEFGRVRVHSEAWQAHSRAPLVHGQKIRVVAREGLVLIVEPSEPTTPGMAEVAALGTSGRARQN
jgi:membrane-bound serine protease (ClpP class)